MQGASYYAAARCERGVAGCEGPNTRVCGRTLSVAHAAVNNENTAKAMRCRHCCRYIGGADHAGRSL